MQGVNYLSGANLSHAAPGWKLGGTGDFNFDGKPDLVLHNEPTGLTRIWYMNGAVRASEGLPPTQSDLAMKLVATGYFDTDGRLDLLWRHQSTGAMLVWFMDGHTRLGTGAITPTQPDINWNVVAAADFNRDRKTDLGWWRSTDGQVEIWLMDGTARQAVSAIGSLSLDVRVVGPR
jgi:hypothetical protein